MNEVKQITQIDDDGIAIMDGFFPSDLCDRYITFFEESSKSGFTHGRWSSNNLPPTVMEDESASFSNGEFLTNMSLRQQSKEFLDIFWQSCYRIYADKFAVLSTLKQHKIFSVKIQKTLPGQGYHVWHCEASTKENSARMMAFILYLNDVNEGGETEFLYRKRRVQPKKGRLLLWPSGYVHSHRGNPPLSGEKYILTGWVEFDL